VSESAPARRQLTSRLEEQYPASTPLSALKGDHYSPVHSQGAYDRIVAQLDTAEKEGRLIVKGERSPGNGKQGGRIGISVVMFKDGLETTDTGVRELLEDESFGPVLVVVPVKVRRLG
jgi:acyl-CoA reductase-like NAD-dependent aldehyde dehydrogenase